MILAFLFACSAHRPTAARGVAAPDQPWERVHAAWTRELRLYQTFETVLLLRATLLAEPWRQARVAELAWREALDESERDALAAREHAQALGAHEVVFAAQRQEGLPRDYGAAPDSPWRLRFSVDGRPCALLDLTREDAPTPADKALFLQANSWSDLWRARFDATCGAEGEAVLAVTGVYGSGELRWTLSGAPP